jgi:hypothetical protein
MGDGGFSRIKHDLVQDLMEQYGKGAYSYALERLVSYQNKNDDMGENLWRTVIADLDEHFKQGEGQ